MYFYVNHYSLTTTGDLMNIKILIIWTKKIEIEVLIFGMGKCIFVMFYEKTYCYASLTVLFPESAVNKEQIF